MTKTDAAVAVVGSGASGLGAAFELRKLGFEVELIDKGDVIGGRFGVAMLGDRPVMTGGKNIGRNYTSFREFIDSTGVHSWESFGYNSSRLKGDQLITIDSSHRLRTLTNIARMGTAKDSALLASLAVRVRADAGNGFLGSNLSAKLADRYDTAPISQHFSPKLSASLLRSLTMRQTGAEPEEAYMGSLPTHIGALFDTYDQLEHSIQPALEAFSRQVEVHTQTTVEGLEVEDRQVVGLRLCTGDGALETRRYAGVIVATPAYATAKLVAETSPELAGELEQVAYFPSSVVIVEYDRPVFSDEVRALAMDDGPCTNIGTYGRNDRNIARFTFSGRDARIGDVSEDVLSSWLDAAEQRVARHLPFGSAQRVRTLRRHWPAAYCGYRPFHRRFLDRTMSLVAPIGRLELAGDYQKGAFIEACFRSGVASAQRLSVDLGARPLVRA